MEFNKFEFMTNEIIFSPAVDDSITEPYGALDDFSEDFEDNPCYDYDEEDVIHIEEPVERPSWEVCNFLRESVPGIFKGEPAQFSRDHYGLNLLNIEDYLSNWDRLSQPMKQELTLIITADWDNENTASDGVKNPRRYTTPYNPREKLAKHLLLLCGLQLRNLGYPYCQVVSSNILQPDGFRNPNRTDQRWIDPRGAVSRIRRFFDKYNPGALMHENAAMILLFDAGEQFRHVGDLTLVKAEFYQMFFSKNEEILIRWMRKGFIRAYFISHEISVHSIKESTFRPHSHVVIWFNPNSDLEFLNRLKKSSTRMSRIDRIYRNWNELSNYIPYLFKVTRFAETYEREFADLVDDEVVQFNVNASQALGKLLELGKNTLSIKRRYTHGGLPLAI